MKEKGIEALEGLRVLDLGQVFAGNFASALLGDFGAEVIKIERPKLGDGLRYMGRVVDGISMPHTIDNRNKKCVTLDLKSAKGRELFLKLVEIADVVVENYAPGVMESLGLSFADLEKVNPRIILGRISGFGQTGPKRNFYGYDRVGMGFGGITYISGDPDGPPMRPGVAVADYMSGLFCALGVLIALYNRDVVGTGKGQYIDLALYESVFRIIETAVVDYKMFGAVRQRMGNDAPTGAPANNYLTKDGQWVSLAVSNDRVFSRLAAAIGREDLLADQRFAHQVERQFPENKAALDQIAREWIASHDEAECAAAFEGVVPYTKILSIEDIFKEAQYAARENIVAVMQDKIGKIYMQGVVPKLSRTPGKVKWAGASLGSANEEILKGMLGLSDAEYQELVDQSIV